MSIRSKAARPYATESRRLWAALQDVQDALGHAHPRTTRRYDRSRYNLEDDSLTISRQVVKSDVLRELVDLLHTDPTLVDEISRRLRRG